MYHSNCGPPYVLAVALVSADTTRRAPETDTPTATSESPEPSTTGQVNRLLSGLSVAKLLNCQPAGTPKTAEQPDC